MLPRSGNGAVEEGAEVAVSLKKHECRGHSAFRVATCNVETLRGREKRMLRMMVHRDVDIMCVQEARIPRDSLPSLRSMMMKAGYEMFAQRAKEDSTGRTTGGLLLFSRWPVIKYKTPRGWRDRDRVLLFAIHRPHEPALHCATLHMPHEAVRQTDLLLQLEEFMAEKGGEHMLIGDFNLTPQEGAVAEHLAAGTLYLPETEMECQVPTRPQGTRHIDYALHTPSLRVRAREVFDGMGDHLTVSYDIACEKLEDTWSWPPCARIPEDQE